jgi:uncharacterized membrane protein
VIIFGSRTIPSTVATGEFSCRVCNMHRTYHHINARRFFTLYFIPIIPIGSAGEYIQCSSCGGTFGVEQLSYHQTRNWSETAADIRRSVVLVLLQSDHVSDRSVAELCSACAQLLSITVTPAQVYDEVRLAREAGAAVEPFVSQRLRGITPLAAESAVQMAVRSICADRSLDNNDESIVRRYGAALGLPSSVIESILTGEGA